MPFAARPHLGGSYRQRASVDAIVVVAASVHLANVEGPRLRELELASSP